MSLVPQYRRIIFVDMDGVLLPFPNKRHDDNHTSEQESLFPAVTLRPLYRLWKHVGTVEWVLSSTWRVQDSYIRDIERALHEFGIHIEFSDITDPKLHSERQWEIYDWLKRQKCFDRNNHNNKNNNNNDYTTVWLALDDEELIEGEKNSEYRSLFEGHVVCTMSHLGLTEEDVDKAIALWDRQLLPMNS